MARNRKNESAASRFAPALKALLLFAFFVTAGVGYVGYKSQTKILGDQKRACELRLSSLQQKNASLQAQLKILQSPVALELQVKKLNSDKNNLGLGPPAQTQVVRLVESAPESTPPGSMESSAFVSRQVRPGSGKTN